MCFHPFKSNYEMKNIRLISTCPISQHDINKSLVPNPQATFCETRLPYYFIVIVDNANAAVFVDRQIAWIVHFAHS